MAGTYIILHQRLLLNNELIIDRCLASGMNVLIHIVIGPQIRL